MHPILLMTVAALLLPAGSPAPLHGGGMSGSGISIWGGCPGNPGLCEFGLRVSDPNLIFFRWDFDGDGRWDSGSPPFNTWLATIGVSFFASSGGYRTVCAQGWDGVTTKYVGSGWEPVGPIVCKILLLGGDFTVSPASWDRASTGTAVATWILPAEFTPWTAVPQSAMIAGVPATPIITIGVPGRPFVARFEVDRAALTTALGPGTHPVVLSGTWDRGPFSVWGGVQFSADGLVTIT